MNSSRSPRSGRRPTALLAALLVLPMAACAPGPAPTPTGTNSGTAPTNTAPTNTETPSAGPAITIDSPVADSPVTIPVSARGTADTVEAALVIDLLDEAGQTLCVRHLTATSGSGTAGTWQSDLAFPPPENEEAVTLRAYELSAEDGSETNVVERSLTLTPERPPIIITTPACGASVAPGGTLEVTGRAMVPEAQFTLELRDPAGAAVLTQQVLAASGTEESDFSSTLSVPAGLAAGFYDLVGFDNSLKDGSVQYEFPVQLLVQ
ncbi:hypothetical protein E3T61_05350 [Cryobacterium lactosi]|uniref:Bacterial spore germination immunoglobulin-like domain-containing protein n=1 Tax=Cryobacterium lactosi TaxID=1259202 RepID=A0A4R9BYE4_9MICO|nr:Gmad2 immunoglobulin-like domain-containing protein [Cryobacterium lactosi]TFD93511.1 hypothetical protein E3T61_05350 [Cryobacterium lactosi]